MDTWTPPEAPGYSSNKRDTTPRLITADFGNGYKLVIPDGPTPYDRTATYMFNDLSPTNLSLMTSFLIAHIGQTFLWTPPLASAPIKFRATSWSETDTGRANTTLTINLEKSYELS